MKILNKEQIFDFIRLWEKTPTSEMSKIFGVSETEIRNIASKIRKEGIDLPYRTVSSQIKAIRDAVKEINQK